MKKLESGAIARPTRLSVQRQLIPTFLAVAAALVGCKRTPTSSNEATATRATAAVSASAAPATPPLKIPATHATFKLDGELSEPVWNSLSARTHGFVDPGGKGDARPYSEARFLWDADNLYVGLYAADDDLEAKVTQHDGPVWMDDAFALELRPAEPANAPTYHFDISPAGVVTDAKRAPGGKDDVTWESGVKLGVDKDGTLNNPKDMDEEWVVEAAIPLASMGIQPKAGTRVFVTISRCDTPHGTKERRCGAWGTPSAPRVLEFAL